MWGNGLAAGVLLQACYAQYQWPMFTWSGGCEREVGWVHPKYGDVCEDYEEGGESREYRCTDEIAKLACCECEGNPTSQSTDCTVDVGWTHPKYGDTCMDYALGGESYKYRCKDALAAAACCQCEEVSQACTVDEEWVHPKYGDTCVDYQTGGASYKYRCKDDEAKAACCACEETEEEEAEEEAEALIAANRMVPGEPVCHDVELGTDATTPWHDAGGEKYDCVWYAEANRCVKNGHKYENHNMTANQACCTCGGGAMATCRDRAMEDASPWHEKGKPNYDCAYYGLKISNCQKYGHKYADEFDGMVANDACCVCGGGEVKVDKPVDSNSGLYLDDLPLPDAPDDILTESWGGVNFRHKKHIAGEMLVYWVTDDLSQQTTFGLLSAPSHKGWIAMGFSATGFMAGSDAVVGFFNKDTGEAVVNDYYLANQSPSGVRLENRQDLKDSKLYQLNDRIGMVFTRAWDTDAGATTLQQADFTDVIYAYGPPMGDDAKSILACQPFCNHQPDGRFQTELALVAPEYLTVYELNLGIKGEPCQGVAKLECNPGLVCYHEFAANGDPFAANWQEYGICFDKEDVGDNTAELDSRSGEQLVFVNDGGFENKTELTGGLVMLFTVNKVSPPGSFGPEDTVAMAVVNTNADDQGWLGFGFSPNGDMKGSDVVIGWDDGATNSHIGDYFLEAQVAAVNKVANKQELVNERVIRKNGQTAIMFERKCTPADSVQLLEGLVHVIYATGKMPDEEDQEYIPYHNFRRNKLETFIPVPPELLHLVGAAQYEDCAGPLETTCQLGLVCSMYSEETIQKQLERYLQAKEAGLTAITTGRGAIWKDKNETVILDMAGRGQCLPVDVQDIDKSMWARNDVINPRDWDAELLLGQSFSLFWKVVNGDQPGQERLRLALKLGLSRRGFGWLGLGFPQTEEGLMTGSSAVIGWADRYDADNKKAAEYYLREKLPWEIRSVIENPDDPTMEATDIEFLASGTEQALIYERPMAAASGVAEIKQGVPNTIIYAVGNVPREADDFFGYHRYRGVKKNIIFWPHTEEVPILVSDGERVVTSEEWTARPATRPRG